MALLPLALSVHAARPLSAAPASAPPLVRALSMRVEKRYDAAVRLCAIAPDPGCRGALDELSREMADEAFETARAGAALDCWLLERGGPGGLAADSGCVGGDF